MVQEDAPPGRKFVLVVEDEPLLLLMAGDIVGDAGLEAILVPNADEAIRILESRDDRWPPIKLVVVSGHLTADADLPQGARFFRKPYASDQIISALRQLVA